MTSSTIARTRSDATVAARLRSLLGSLRGEVVLVIVLALIGLVAHAINMFHYPAFTFLDDEGIYASQAWAVLRLGRLTPYTYFYDHAPVGWIMTAIWMAVTGGEHTFGGLIDSGRVFMLVLHVAMVPLLYHITRKLGAGVGGATLAALLFSLSPLAIFYQRMLLLDNIMLFWALLSLDLLLDGWGRLSRVVLSGITFGLAILSKETAVFLLPVMVLILFQQRWRHQGRFTLVAWLMPMAVVTSWYPLYALLKGELLPAGSAFSTLVFNHQGSGGVSLTEAARWQASRGGGGLFNLNGELWQLLRTDWLQRDPLLVIAGSVAVLINLVRGLRDRRLLMAGLLGASALFYLARGGIVLNYYILFAIPFLALNLALLVSPLFSRLPGLSGSLVSAALVAVLFVGGWAVGKVQPLYTAHPDQAGRAAIAWVQQHLPPDSKIIARDYVWPDLHAPQAGTPAFPNVHSLWKVGSDPAVRDGVFNNDWHNVDYLLVSPNDQQLFQASNNTLALQAIQHAHIVQRWTVDQTEVDLWKVDKAGSTEQSLMAGSASYMAQTFAKGGAWQASDGSVTSEAQSYALLRSVWSGDRQTFDTTWNWTRTHLLASNGLMSWLWRGGAVVDTNTAADADVDTALALLLAGKRWNDPTLTADGTAMVQAIWKNEVVVVNGAPYVTAGNWAASKAVVALDPSYFAPYAYRIFQEVDHTHNWSAAVDAGYQMLYNASSNTLGAARSSGLPPDWVGLERSTGKLVPLQLDNRDTTRYGYDAARTYWRIALDYQWTKDGRAQAYLSQAGFLRDEAQRKGLVGAVYGHDGSLVEKAPSTVGTAGAVAALMTLDPATANNVYAGQIVSSVQRNSAGFYWGNAQDLYAQEWGWFTTALYANQLTNLYYAK